MSQHLRKPAQGSTSDLTEEVGDLDIICIVTQIDNLKPHPVAIEYGLLNMLSNPTEKQNDRIQSILDEACESYELEFWITEVNHILGHRQDCLDDEHRRGYEKSKEILRGDLLEFKNRIEESGSSTIIDILDDFIKDNELMSKLRNCVSSGR